MKTKLQEMQRIIDTLITPKVKVHGIAHWTAVADTALSLAQLENQPENILRAVWLAGYLHDCGRITDLTSTDPNHGQNSVRLINELKILEKLPGLDLSLKAEICFAIENHTRGRQTEKPVAKYLWDADRLNFQRFDIDRIRPELMSTTVWPLLCK